MLGNPAVTMPVMGVHNRDLVAWILSEPQALLRLTEPEFGLLLRQARSANLVARVAELADSWGPLLQLPAGLVGHFAAAHCVRESHHAQVMREIEFLRQTMSSIGLPLVLLKGAGYVASKVAASSGRLFNDVDILVPEAALDRVEEALQDAGWMGSHHSAYDQRYYREWMHELPPMTHVRRRTSLDVHHAITPRTARWQVDSRLLLDSAVPVPCLPGVAVLAPVDMVLHSMVHLSLNEEFSHGLRDLSDIALLLQSFGRDADFWPSLLARAERLNLRRACHHGLWCARHVLGVDVPHSLAQDAAGWGPPIPAAAVLRACWSRVLTSPHASNRRRGAMVAEAILFLRAHWLRMPPRLLALHLCSKAFKRHANTRDTLFSSGHGA